MFSPSKYKTKNTDKVSLYAVTLVTCVTLGNKIYTLGNIVVLLGHIWFCSASWRLLLLALPGIFCLPFFVIIKLFLRKTCLDEVSIKLNNLVSYTYAIVNISASARDYSSFRRLLQTTFENLTRNIYSPVLISKNIRKKVKTEHICLLFVCLFIYLFYFTFFLFFSFLFFSFFLSFFHSFIISFFLYLFIYLFGNFPAL